MRAGAAILAAAGLAGNAWAGCVSNADMAALKTAAMQQELMVAAFSCHDIALYNQFVRSHQPELVRSDARLKAYFIQRDGARAGEASYHTYKTELANSSSLRSIRSTDEFCDRAGADFDLAGSHAMLSAAVDEHRWAIESIYHACHPSDAPILADASTEPPPSRTEFADADDARRDVRPMRSGGRRPERDSSAQSEVKTPAPHRPLDGDAL